MKKISLFYFLIISSVSIFSQTTLFSDGFENGKGSWLFSTPAGGNDYKITPATGYNSDNSVRCKTIGSPNFMISPAVTFGANKAYKIRFMAYVQTANSRKIDVYYNTAAALNGNEVLAGTVSNVGTVYTPYTIDLISPPTGVKYIILKGTITGATWVFLSIDNFEVVETGNFIPTVSFSSPTDNYSHTAGTSLPVNITAADADGTVNKVNLYYRGELFGSIATPPYNFFIPNLPIGASTLYARAYDNAGDSATTATITVNGVNLPPTIALTAPAGNISINQGSIVSLSATASDADGSVTEVSFYVNGSNVATKETAPYTFDWSNPNPGLYVVSATATDNTGLQTTTSAATITSTATTNGYLITENFEDGIVDWAFSVNSGGNDWKFAAGVGFNSTDCIKRKSGVKNFMTHTSSIYYSAATYTVKVVAKASKLNYYSLQPGLVNGTDTIWGSVSAYAGTTYNAINVSLVNTVGGYYKFILRTVKNPADASIYNDLFIDDLSVYGAGGFPNIPPVVKFSTPTNSSEIALNTATNITSSAYDSDGNISKVEYYIENEYLGQSTSAPYTISWTPTFSGVFSLKAKATDNDGKSTTNVISVLVNYADRKVYDFVASSYLGGEAGSGKVWGTKVLSDGVIVLACDWGTVMPAGAVVHLLNGATINSRGAIVRISADGKTVLSVTKIGAYAVDLSIDNSDNIYVAAGTSGLVKVNRLADKLLLTKTFAKTVYRVDAGKTGHMVVLTLPGVDFDGKKWGNVTVFVMNPAGDILTSFGGASQYSNDVCIDEASQSAVVVGWKNVYTWEGTTTFPVDIPGFKIFSFSGVQRFNGYNWSSDSNSPNWINASDNNMADTRIARVSMGDDGLMYFMAEVSGGNHPLRYSPYDIFSKVRFVGGDHFHTLSNVGTEFHAYIARMNIATGAWIEGQSFTARLLPAGNGNTIDPEHGNVAADVDGRVYFTGKSAYGTPLSREILPEISYTGGAFIYIMNPTMQTRELVDRVVQKNGGRDIAVRKFANHDKTIVYGGDVAFTSGQPLNSFLYLKNPVQNTFYGAADEEAGFYAVIGGTTPAQYELKVNGVSKGMFAEGTKVALNAADYGTVGAFIRWSNGQNYIADSTAVATTFSMPGMNANLTTQFSITTINTIHSELDLKVYPNPAIGQVRISTGSNLPTEIRISNLTGKIVWNGMVKGSQTLNLSQLPKGVYIISANNSINQKLVVR